MVFFSLVLSKYLLFSLFYYFRSLLLLSMQYDAIRSSYSIFYCCFCRQISDGSNLFYSYKLKQTRFNNNRLRIRYNLFKQLYFQVTRMYLLFFLCSRANSVQAKINFFCCWRRLVASFRFKMYHMWLFIGNKRLISAFMRSKTKIIFPTKVLHPLLHPFFLYN